jgi:LacI family transcriptional regulator
VVIGHASGYPSFVIIKPMDDIPTLLDIAKKSGYSKSTVSLALRRHPRIPETTRRCIEQVAAKIGYRPDPALARLAASRWRRVPTQSTIAYVTTNHPSGGLLDVLQLAGTRSRAKMFGYQLEHFRFEEYGSAKRLGQTIYSRGIKGVIIGKLSREDLVQDFPWQHFACIACDSGFVRPPILMVMPDHAHAVHRAWQEAAARGYRRIGLVLFTEYSAVDYFDKVSAYLFNQRTVPASDRLPVAHVNPTAYHGLKDWILQAQPDVILGFNPLVHHWLHELGYRMPQDLGFIALMDANEHKPFITRLEEDMHLVGQIALEQLDILLRTNHYGLPKVITTQLIESKWMLGSTVRDIPKRSVRRSPAANSAG